MLTIVFWLFAIPVLLIAVGLAWLGLLSLLSNLVLGN